MTKMNLNMPGSSVKRIEKGCDALLLPYEDVVEAIRSHFSGTVFSHVLLSKAFGEEYELSRIPIEMRGEARLVAGLFRIDCYFGDLPGEKPMTVAFVRDSGYEVPNKDCFFHLGPLESRTMCMISAAAERDDESSIADIMVAAVCHEILYRIRHEDFCHWKNSGTAEKRCVYLLRNAERILSAKKYRLWNRGRYYVYDLDDDDVEQLILELSADVPNGAMIGEAIFKSFGHLFEECRFEIINSKVLERNLFCYEQAVYQHIRDNRYDEDVKGYLADIERFRVIARESNNIPLARNHNLPAVVEKRIDDYIEILKKER